MKIQDPQSQPVNSTLADLLKSGNETTLRPYRVLIGHNMGFNTLLLCVPIDKFYDISEVANRQNIEEKGVYDGEPVAQRELDLKHAEGLATYLLKGLFASVEAKAKLSGTELPEEFYEMQEDLGPQPYLALQPITANIRSCDFGGGGLRVEQSVDGTVTVYLAPKHVLWVIDGQHRREAMRILFEYLKEVTTTLKYPRRNLMPGKDSANPVTSAEHQVWNMILEAWRSGCTVAAEIHLGLDARQERQLFHDLNNLTKKVAPSLAFTFDNANPVNVFIKQHLIDPDGALFKDKVVERDNTPWIDDKGFITRKDLIAINSLLFMNKSNARGASPAAVTHNRDYAVRFWDVIRQIPNFAAAQAKVKTVAAQPVLLKSLAKLAYTFGLGRSSDLPSLEKLLAGIPSIDFSHTNPMWRFHRLSAEERDSMCPGLVEYLPSGFVEVGSYDDKQQVFRFSPLHNDVIPSISDMIRWSLQLPNRFADRGLMPDGATDDGAPLAIEIDYPAIGMKRPAETISEPKASDTMRKVMESLVAAYGRDVLKQIACMRDGRRPLVSSDPDTDFRIGDSDKIYQNQEIGSTGTFVLTSTDSAQKVRDLREVAGVLGISADHFRIRANLS